MVPPPLDVDGHQVQTHHAAIIPVDEQVAHQAGRESWSWWRAGMMTEPSQTLSKVLGTVEECRVEEERVQWLGHEGVARTAWTGQTSPVKYDYWLPSAVQPQL